MLIANVNSIAYRDNCLAECLWPHPPIWILCRKEKEEKSKSVKRGRQMGREWRKKYIVKWTYDPFLRRHVEAWTWEELWAQGQLKSYWSKIDFSFIFISDFFRFLPLGHFFLSVFVGSSVGTRPSFRLQMASENESIQLSDAVIKSFGVAKSAAGVRAATQILAQKQTIFSFPLPLKGYTSFYSHAYSSLCLKN